MTEPLTEWNVRKGEALRVRFGSTGSQYAVCIGHNRNDRPMIVKWSGRSRKWSKPMRLDDSIIVGRAGLSDWSGQGEPQVPHSLMERYK